MTSDDAQAVLAIYQSGLDTGEASFETAAPQWEAFDQSHLPQHRFVAEAQGQPVGWIAIKPVLPQARLRGRGRAQRLHRPRGA